MEGRLCVTRVTQENVEGYFVAPRREEYVKIKREMINVPVVPGNVLRVDYSWSSVAVFETLDDKFFDVEVDVQEIIRFNHIQIADSEEEAKALFKERLEESYHRLKKSLETETVNYEVME